MKLHEYQAKVLFSREGVPVPYGGTAASVKEADEVLRDMPHFPVAVKAQIHAGGRGKGGGIKVAGNREAALEAAANIIGTTLVTPQTGPKGRLVGKVLLESALPVQKEFYLAITIDRQKARPVILASSAGGMEIEDIVKDQPQLLLKETVDPAIGIMPYQIRNIFFQLGLESSLLASFASVISGLYGVFTKYDCSLVEVNPLVLTMENQFYALDAKVDVDDCALFRQKELLGWREFQDAWEEEAARYRLNYIRLDGTVGMMVNGAGMAMATMDAIALAGAKPANFLDVGGGASADAIANGFRLILSDEQVKLVLINIFGGILRCDVLAEGVINAVSTLEVKIPVIVRLAGTNKDKGSEMLSRSGLNFSVARDMNEVISIISQYS